MKDRWLALAVLALALAAFAPSLSGDFVYDDRRQILDNPSIRDLASLPRALVSDVWAFKGDRDEPWSNYWRPAFVATLAIEHALFGTRSPVPWHAVNVLLHALVSALAFLWLRRLGLARWAAAGAAALFAVHPVHVESVAWISGLPDLLVAAFLLGALVALGVEGRPLRCRRAIALVAFAFALASKEVAVLFPALVFAIATTQAGTAGTVGGAGARARAAAGARAAAPFALLSVVFLVVRHAVLGRVSVEVPWRLDTAELLFTAPSLIAFYLRQSLLPLRFGPSYPLRAVTGADISLLTFVVPIAIVVVTGWVLVRLARREPPARVLALLFALPLLPALYVNAFIQEHLVHDRYLYLPLLGLVGSCALLATRCANARPGAAPPLGAAAVVAVALCLGQSLGYTRAWRSEIALWERGVRSDPGSAFNLAQLGHALLAAGRADEALLAFDRALAVRPVTSALLDRASLLAARGRAADAEHDLLLVLAAQPDNPLAYERLAAVLRSDGRLEQAAAVLARGRDAAPHRSCSMRSNLAVVQVLAGRRSEALAELEAAWPRIGVEATLPCDRAAFLLGTLYAEAGRRGDARRAYGRFLEISGAATDSSIAALRAQARDWLSADYSPSR